MTSAVLAYQPPSHEIMPPSPLVPKTSRHGRSRHGGSIAKSKARGRGYSINDDREWLISKTLTKILKHVVSDSTEKEGDEYQLIVHPDGWVECRDILAHPDLLALNATYSDLEILSNGTKARFSLKLKPDTEILDDDPASAYLICIITSTSVAPEEDQTPTQKEPVSLNINTPDLPKLVAYETSYANYPLILASGGIKRAGGQTHLSFKPVTLVDTTEMPPVTADVSIYVDLPSIISTEPKIQWLRSETGAILTEGDEGGRIEKSFWKSVVARRKDIGVLFKDGEVKKEVPIGLRGKGVKPKKGGKGRVKNEGEEEIRDREEEIRDHEEEIRDREEEETRDRAEEPTQDKK